MTDDHQLDLGPLADLPDEDLEDLVEAIQQGATCPAEAFGFGPEAQAAVENIALSYYQTKLFRKAAQVFAFLIRLNPTRASAWRGLGACCQAEKLFAQASDCYAVAVQNNPSDIISRVYLGECLCQLGDKNAGLAFLTKAIEDAGDEPKLKFYVARATAIVNAKGGIPPAVVLRNKGRQLAEQATQDLAALTQQEQGAPQFDPTREITPEDMRNNPVLREDLKALWEAVKNGNLTLGEIGGFTAKEMEGAYACACKYVEISDYLHGMQILGWLMFLDPYNGKYYQLLGIIMQRHKSHGAAEQYYDMALQFDPDNAMTYVYRGEAKIMLGRREEGLEDVRRGLELADGVKEHEETAKRGQVLLRQFSGAGA